MADRHERFSFSHGADVNTDSGGGRAELVGQSEGVRSGIVLLCCRDHEGGELGRVLHMVPFVPVGQSSTRVNPLHSGNRVSREHPCHC